MKNFQGSFNTFNNNKSALAPKRVTPTKLNKTVLSLLEDSGDLVFMSRHPGDLYYFKLNQQTLTTIRLNSTKSNLSKQQLKLFNTTKKTVLYTRYKNKMYRFGNNSPLIKDKPWCYRKTR